MLFTTFLDKNIRRIYLADASSVVLWSLFTSNVLAFVFVLARRAGAGPELIAVCTSLMYVPCTLAFVMPMLSRRVPLGAMVILLRVLAGAGMLYCALVPTLTGLAVAFIIAVLAYGFVEIGYPALFNALYPAEHQTRVLGLIQTERSALVFVSLLALGPMLKALDSTGGIRLLGGLGVLGILSGLLAWRFRQVKEAVQGEKQTLRTVLAPFAHRGFLIYVVGLAVLGIGNVIFGITWPLLQVDTFEFTNAQVGVIGALQTLMMMVTYFAFSRFGVIRASKNLVVVPFLLGSAHLTTCAALLHFPALQPAAYPLMLASVAVTSIGNGLHSIYFYLMVNAMAEQQGQSALSFQAAQNIVIGIRGFVVPVPAGILIAHAGLQPAVLAALGFMWLGILVTLLPVPKRPTAAPLPVAAADNG